MELVHPFRKIDISVMGAEYVAVTDLENNVIAPMESVKDWETLQSWVVQNYESSETLSEYMRTINSVFTGTDKEKSKQQAEHWKYVFDIIRANAVDYAITKSKIQIIKFQKSNDYCFRFIDMDETKGDVHPAWDEFLDRIPSETTPYFLAWIWSIFAKDDSTRLVCWFHGDGNDGKSFIYKAISEYLGFLAVEETIWNPDNKFTLSKMVGKKLVYVPDNKSPKLIENQLIKNVSGGDRVTVEKKNRDPFSAVMQGKIMVGSNCAPEISEDAASTSRLMYIKLAPAVTEIVNATAPHIWQKNLISEVPVILKKAKSFYDKLTNGRQILKLPKEMTEQVLAHTGDDFTFQIRDFLSSHYEITNKDQDRVKMSELTVQFKVYVSENGFASSTQQNAAWERFKSFMKIRGVKPGKSRINGSSPTSVFIGIRLRTEQPDKITAIKQRKNLEMN